MTDTPDRPGEHGRQEDEPTLTHGPFPGAASSPEAAAEADAGAERRPPEAPRADQQADDPRRSLEAAEHHDDAAVLAHVGDRLGAAPDVVEVGDATRAEHAQRAARALRGDVDVAVSGERGGAEVSDESDWAR